MVVPLIEKVHWTLTIQFNSCILLSENCFKLLLRRNFVFLLFFAYFIYGWILLSFYSIFLRFCLFESDEKMFYYFKWNELQQLAFQKRGFEIILRFYLKVPLKREKGNAYWRHLYWRHFSVMQCLLCYWGVFLVMQHAILIKLSFWLFFLQ